MNKATLHITQHIRYGLTPLPFGTLPPAVATSYMLGTLYEIGPFLKEVRVSHG